MGETLSKPITTKQTFEQTCHTDGERLRCGVSCMQGDPSPPVAELLPLVLATP